MQVTGNVPPSPRLCYIGDCPVFGHLANFADLRVVQGFVRDLIQIGHAKRSRHGRLLIHFEHLFGITKKCISVFKTAVYKHFLNNAIFIDIRLRGLDVSIVIFRGACFRRFAVYVNVTAFDDIRDRRVFDRELVYPFTVTQRIDPGADIGIVSG